VLAAVAAQIYSVAAQSPGLAARVCANQIDRAIAERPNAVALSGAGPIDKAQASPAEGFFRCSG
jgi:hypothetical protein